MLRTAFFAAFALIPSTLTAQDSQDSQNYEPWIFSQQRPDGSWSASTVPADVAGTHPGAATDDGVVTSLLALALLGEGHKPALVPGQDRLAGALDWLLQRQGDEGLLAAEASTTALADHALATLTLSEAAFLGGGSRYRVAAKAAVSYLESSPLPGGGWSASGAADGDLDVRATYWASMALASARDAGLCKRPELIGAAAWRLRAEGAAHPESAARDIAFELMTRVLAGENASTSDEFATRAAELLALPVTWKADGQGFDPECVYVQSLLAYQCGGKLWKSWQKTMKSLQRTMGLEETHRLAVDPSVPGGSLAAYAYTALTLKVYFRFANVVGLR